MNRDDERRAAVKDGAYDQSRNPPHWYGARRANYLAALDKRNSDRWWEQRWGRHLEWFTTIQEALATEVRGGLAMKMRPGWRPHDVLAVAAESIEAKGGRPRGPLAARGLLAARLLFTAWIDEWAPKKDTREALELCLASWERAR